MSTHSTKATTTIHAFPLSQPSRAVLWAAAIKKTDYEYKEVNVMLGESQLPTYTSLFPPGFIPGLEVRSGGDDKQKPFCITEGAAILSYLAEANGWTDLYPSGNSLDALQQRAEIQKWLHWCHEGLRFATTDVFRPAVMEQLKQKAKESAVGKVVSAVADTILPDPSPEQLKKEEDERAFHKKEVDAKWKEALRVMTESSLKAQPFLAGDHCTIADIMCYCEIDQIYYCGMYHFEEWPEVMAWIKRMQQVPEHDAIRAALFKFVNDFGFNRSDAAAKQ